MIPAEQIASTVATALGRPGDEQLERWVGDLVRLVRRLDSADHERRRRSR